MQMRKPTIRQLNVIKHSKREMCHGFLHCKNNCVDTERVVRCVSACVCIFVSEYECACACECVSVCV